MTATATAAAPVKEAPYFTEKVLWVKHWTDRLFSFAITRPASFRFRSGEFVMIGLPPREELGEKKPILRAYSIGSPHFAEELEFFSIKVPDTSRSSAHARTGCSCPCPCRAAKPPRPWTGPAPGWRC